MFSVTEVGLALVAYAVGFAVVNLTGLALEVTLGDGLGPPAWPLTQSAIASAVGIWCAAFFMGGVAAGVVLGRGRLALAGLFGGAVAVPVGLVGVCTVAAVRGYGTPVWDLMWLELGWGCVAGTSGGLLGAVCRRGRR